MGTSTDLTKGVQQLPNLAECDYGSIIYLEGRVLAVASYAGQEISPQ